MKAKVTLNKAKTKATVDVKPRFKPGDLRPPRDDQDQGPAWQPARRRRGRQHRPMSDVRAAARGARPGRPRSPGRSPRTGAHGDPYAADNLVRRALQVLPVLVFVGTCLAVVKYAARPITNADTFFHLRFGSEFLSGLEPARPRLRDAVRHSRLAPDPVGAADADGVDGRPLGAGRRRLARRRLVPPVRPGALRRRAATGPRAGGRAPSRSWPSRRRSRRCRPGRRR